MLEQKFIDHWNKFSDEQLAQDIANLKENIAEILDSIRASSGDARDGFRRQLKMRKTYLAQLEELQLLRDSA